MQKIRILEIDVRGDLGGGSSHLATLLAGLDDEKFEIYSASPKNELNSKKYAEFSKATIDIPFRRFDCFAYQKLKRFTEENKIHLIHSHGRGAGIYSRLLGRSLKLPVIHTFHGVSFEKNSLLEFLGIPIERWLGKWTAQFIHVSNSERDYGRTHGISDEFRSCVIQNGIDISQFNSSQSSGRIRSELGLSDADIVIGCVARFDPVKNHALLMDAFAQLAPSFPDLKLLLIGSGETEGAIKVLAKKKGVESAVKFLGIREDVKPYYAVFDLFVLPSKHEGLPITPLEALASKCPVILSDVRGNRDIVIHGETGLLFPNNDAGALRNEIQQLITNVSIRSSLAENGFQMVKRRFPVENMITSVQKLYENLCPHPEYRKIALAHDWLFHMRGGEKVLEAIGELFPAAPIYTLFAEPKHLSQSLRTHQIFPSFLNQIPFVSKFYRFLLPLFPLAVRTFNLKQYDLIVSSSHAVIKGVGKGGSTTHICYCHTPMRYAWGFREEYFGKYPLPIRKIISGFLNWLKKWDLKNSEDVDHFIANSKNIAGRIKKFYNRDAFVIYPPIQSSHGSALAEVKDFFLIVSALVPYKRIDIAVEAFNISGAPLIVIGSGPLKAKLERMATNNISFLGWLDDSKIKDYYASCRALIFPTDEDFGMVPVEAMMYGKPVIAYRSGGALETVISPDEYGDPKMATGLFFNQPTAKSLAEAVKSFENYRFNPNYIQKHAEKFKTENFKLQFLNFLNSIAKPYAESLAHSIRS